MGRKKTKTFHDIEVVDIGHKGLCIGRTSDGMAVLVEDSLPGRVISGTSRRKKKGMHLVRPSATIKPSPYEVQPRCSHFGHCGGCKWQHMSYKAQITFKDKQVHDTMHRVGGQEGYEQLPIVASQDVFAFRNKMEFSFSAHRWLTQEEVDSEVEHSRLALGLHPPGRFDRVVDIDTCHLMGDEVNAMRNYVRDHACELGLTFYDVRGRQGDMRSLVIRSNRAGQYMVVVVFGTRQLQDAHHGLLQALAEQFHQITSLHYMCNEKANDSLYDLEVHLHSGQPFLEETLCDRRYLIGPKSFFQTNPNQTEQLYQTVAAAADLQPGQVAYDLYAGLGSIAIFVSRPEVNIVAVEEVAPAIDDAKVNARLNGCEHIQFYTGRMEDLVVEMDDKAWPAPDVIITDPPRAGMHERVVHFIMKKAPQRVVYVSCNPATLARDVKLLTSGYRLISLQAFDMFPHTSHVEALAVLERIDT